jgi:hypothetical protein
MMFNIFSSPRSIAPVMSEDESAGILYLIFDEIK